MGVTQRDARWLRSAFLLATENLDDQALNEVTFTEALLRPYDTTPGGYEVINPLPQFTRFCDIKQQSPLARTYGIGRFHEETYGQLQQKIYMSFGVPKFTPMTQFFTGFYNANAALLARTGRGDADLAYNAGRVIGLAVTIFNLPLLILTVSSKALKFMLDKHPTKFYYFKATMPTYWTMLGTLVNHHCVNVGIIPRMFTQQESQNLGMDQADATNAVTAIGQKIGVFDSHGQLDVYRFCTLAHRRKKLFMRTMQSMMDKDGMDFAAMHAAFKKLIDGGLAQPTNSKSYQDYIKLWQTAQWNNPNTANSTGDTYKSTQTETTDVSQAEKQGLLDAMKTELDDASLFVCFRVNSTGEVSESFSNSTSPSSLAQKINSTSSSSADSYFNMSGGNIAGVLQAPIEMIKSVVSGVADQLSIAGLAVLGGAAMVDIPDHWESSSSQLPSQSYTMSLVSPSGNPIAQLFSMYIPLYAILAGALPRSTGPQSYTSPFICQLFDKGKQQTRLGIIDSVSVRRGVTNLPFNRHMSAMGIEVTWTVKDLSTIMHAPISEGFSFDPQRSLFDEDTIFSDYMAVLAAMELDDQIYTMRKLALNMTKWAADWHQWSSSSHLASFLANNTPIRMFSVFYKGIDP